MDKNFQSINKQIWVTYMCFYKFIISLTILISLLSCNDYSKTTEKGIPEEGNIRRDWTDNPSEGIPEEGNIRRDWTDNPSQGIPEEGNIRRDWTDNNPTDGIPEEGNIRRDWTDNPSKENSEESEITEKFNNKGAKEFGRISSDLTSIFIDDIYKYVHQRYGTNATILEKNSYKIRFIISGLKNEVLKNSNQWERIQLDVYLISPIKFLLYIDASYSSGLGTIEPPLSTYKDMETIYYKNLIHYTKTLRYELELFINKRG